MSFYPPFLLDDNILLFRLLLLLEKIYILGKIFLHNFDDSVWGIIVCVVPSVVQVKWEARTGWHWPGGVGGVVPAAGRRADAVHHHQHHHQHDRDADYRHRETAISQLVERSNTTLSTVFTSGSQHWALVAAAEPLRSSCSVVWLEAVCSQLWFCSWGWGTGWRLRTCWPSGWTSWRAVTRVTSSPRPPLAVIHWQVSGVHWPLAEAGALEVSPLSSLNLTGAGLQSTLHPPPILHIHRSVT